VQLARMQELNMKILSLQKIVHSLLNFPYNLIFLDIVGGEVLNMAEFILREKDEIDFYAISLVYGFNIPI